MLKVYEVLFVRGYLDDFTVLRCSGYLWFALFNFRFFFDGERYRFILGKFFLSDIDKKGFFLRDSFFLGFIIFREMWVVSGRIWRLRIFVVYLFLGLGLDEVFRYYVFGVFYFLVCFVWVFSFVFDFGNFFVFS